MQTAHEERLDGRVSCCFCSFPSPLMLFSTPCASTAAADLTALAQLIPAKARMLLDPGAKPGAAKAAAAAAAAAPAVEEVLVPTSSVRVRLRCRVQRWLSLWLRGRLAGPVMLS